MQFMNVEQSRIAFDQTIYGDGLFNFNLSVASVDPQVKAVIEYFGGLPDFLPSNPRL